MELIIVETAEEMSVKAAELFADRIAAKPDIVIGLATGTTPENMYAELAKMNQAGKIDCSQVVTFNLDEYVGLSPHHPQSYHYFMQENLFKHINIEPQNIHIPSGTTSNYHAFCQWYEQRIEQCGGIDIQVLGVGSDGHIAFNEPSSSLGSRTRIKTLSEQTINDNARFFDKKDEVPIYAITMGVGTVLEARKLILLANGTSKAQAIADSIEKPISSMCTASALQLHPDSIFFLDTKAAGKLKMRDYYQWIQAKKPGAPPSS